MSTLKNISEIQKMLKERKSELYAFETHILKPEEEYIKMMYLKVLCSVMQYDNEPNEMQLMFLQRIVLGAGAELEFKEYMRMALELSVEDVSEFISLVSEKSLRYYFAVDSMIVAALSGREKMDYYYIAELIEILGITKKELKYLTVVASAILQQDSAMYQNAKSLIVESVSGLQWKPYVLSFHSGLLIDNQEEKYYASANKGKLNISSEEVHFTEKRVVFENLEINFNADWTFKGCEEVRFKNCILKGNKTNNMTANSVKEFVMENCQVSDFGNRIAHYDNGGNIIIEGNKFTNCGFEGMGRSFYVGGMFKIQTAELVKLKNNYLKNCYMKVERGDHNSGVTGAFSSIRVSGKIEVVGNQFRGCECTGSGEYRKKYETLCGYGSKCDSIIEENNSVVGNLHSVTKEVYGLR